jgi:hypothetical protein
VIVQKANPRNNSQVVAIYNDGELPNLTLNVRALYNTFIGNGAGSAFIHLSNGDGTTMNAEISDNIVSGTGRPFLNDNPAAGTVVGRNNWLRTNASFGPLIGSIQTASPGFLNAGAGDYRLAPNSPCINAADPNVFGLPGREYFLNEATNRLSRIRPSARDVGAFESVTSGTAIGPNDPEPRPELSISQTNVPARIAWPLFAQNYQLQTASELTGAWTNTLAVLQTNAEGVSTEFADEETRFFRLRR